MAWNTSASGVIGPNRELPYLSHHNDNRRILMAMADQGLALVSLLPLLLVDRLLAAYTKD